MRRLWVVWVMALALSPLGAVAAENGRIAMGCGSTVGWFNPDGTDVQTLLQGEAFGWSPDGSRIAYTTNFGAGDIRVRDVTLGPGGDVTIGDATNVFDPLAWSPDGKIAAVVRPSGAVADPGYPDTPGYIDVMNADGSGRHTIVPATHVVWSRPAWSPDGRWLAVGGTDVDDLSLGARIFLFPVTNGEVTGPQVVLTQGAVDDAPAWSPGSDSIVFLRGDLGLWQSIVVRVDFTVGSGTVTVTGEQVVEPASLPTDGLTWSPDGTTVAAARQGVDLYDPDGGNYRRILDAPCSGYLGWQSINTPAGAPVPNVVLRDQATGATPVTLGFDQVTTAGVTTLVMGTQGPPPPANFVLAGVYYDIRTTAAYQGAIQVCIDTTGLGLPASPPPQLFHYTSGAGWQPITVSYAGNQLCGQTTSLSPFAIMRSAAEPPVITTPPEVTAEATGPAGAAVTYTVTVTDPSDPSPSLACAPPSGSVFPLGTTTVECTATNQSGGQSSASFPVHVVDTTAPALALPPDIIVTATSGVGTVVSYVATATDVVSGSLAPACTPASGSQFPVGTTTVECTATDAAGNSAAGTFSVQVTAAADPLAGLVALVQQLVTGSARQQLLAILDDVRDDLAQGHVQDACRDLVRFVARVVWFRLHHVISTSTATQLVSGARQVAQAIHCGCP